jgi:hypothetical protein
MVPQAQTAATAGQAQGGAVTLTKVGLSWMPAEASTMEERGSVVKSVETTASVVNLRKHVGGG